MNFIIDNKLPQPILLLSPDGSFDKQGVVTPTLDGGVSVVAGQFGNAWQCVAPNPNASGTLSVQTSKTGRWVPLQGTMATRVYVDAGNANTCYGIASAAGSPNRAYLGITNAGSPVGIMGSLSMTPSGAVLSAWRTLVMTFDGVNVRMYADGLIIAENVYTGSANGGTVQSAVILGFATTLLVEASLMFDVCLTPMQVSQLFRPRAWTWRAP